jgi:hypothetical protein
MNSTPNPKPTEPDNVLIVSADEGLAHPYRQIAPAGEEITKAISNPKATASGDALVERADIGQAQAHEQIAQANEQVTQSASNPKAAESANGPIEPADERQAREIEWIRKLPSDAAQNPPPVPARPLAAGRPVLRRPIGLLLAASIFVAAFVHLRSIQLSLVSPIKRGVSAEHP